MDEDKVVLPSKDAELDELASKMAGPIDALMRKFALEHEKRFDERDNTLLEQIGKQIDARIAEANEKMATVERKYTVVGAEDGDDGARKGDTYSISRLALASARKDWSIAPFEREVSDELHKTMATDSDTTGGYLVPEFYSDKIIDSLKAQAVVMEMGATEVTVPRGFPIRVPKVTTDVTAVWTPEATEITASDMVIGSMTLTPRTLAARTKLSALLIENSAPAADKIVNMSIASQLALGLDYAALRGTGNNMPLGIINLATLTETLGTTLYYTWLVNMENDVAAVNGIGSRPGFVLHPTVLKNIQLLAGSSTDPDVERKLLTDGLPTKLIGYPFKTTTQLVATGTGCNLFGNWADVWVGRWSNLAIRASDVASDAFEKDEIHVRGLLRADVNIGHPAASFSVGII